MSKSKPGKATSNVPVRLIARATGKTEGQVKAAAKAIEAALRHA